MLDPTVIKEYRKLRKPFIQTGHFAPMYYYQPPAHYCLRNAKYYTRTRAEWKPLEDNNLVRVIYEPDDACSIDDILGDVYDPYVNFNIPRSTLDRQRQEEIELINREGIWGIIGQYNNGREWITAASIWGIIGTDNNDYIYDIMNSTIKAYHN